MRSDIKLKTEDLLRSANLRPTNTRVAILKVLLTAGKPVTQDHIAFYLGSSAPNKVTIYRTLESFLDAGLVHKAFLQERTWHFEPAGNCTESQCHPHFTCTSCSKTQCMMGIAVPMAKNQHKGFIIHRQRVQLEGLCPACASEAKEAS